MKNKKADLYVSRDNSNILDVARNFDIDHTYHLMEKFKGWDGLFSPLKQEDKTIELYYFITQIPKTKKSEECIKFYEYRYKRLLNIWRGRIQDAKKNNIPYDEDAFYDLIIPEYCHVSGQKIDLDGENIEKGGADDAPSIDKIIPLKGYIKGNIQIISFAGNRMLNNVGDHPERIPYLRDYLDTLLEE